MYVKRELARVLYYDMFEKGRVVIKQGKRIDNVEKVSICPMLGKPRQSWILDSPPWIPDSRYIGFRIFGQWNLITIFSGIPDRLNCIPDTIQTPGLRTPQAKMFQISIPEANIFQTLLNPDSLTRGETILRLLDILG